MPSSATAFWALSCAAVGLSPSLGPEDMALAEEVEGVEVSRAADAELAGRVRLTHVEAGGDYAARTAETVMPGGEFLTVFGQRTGDGADAGRGAGHGRALAL